VLLCSRWFVPLPIYNCGTHQIGQPLSVRFLHFPSPGSLISLLAGRIWKAFTSVSLEVVQTLTLAITWAMAQPGCQLQAMVHILALFIITGALLIGYYKYKFRSWAIGTPATPRPRKTCKVPITGSRLSCVALVLILGIAKAVLSFANQSIPANSIDFLIGVPIVLGIMGLGWCESAQIGPKWFFHTDYSWLVLRVLSKFLSLCITVIVALLLLPLGMLRYPKSEPYLRIPEHGPAVRYRTETNFHMIVTAIIGLLVVFTMFEGGLLWGMRSAGLLSSDSPPIRTMSIKWMSRVLSLLYVWVMLWMSSCIWAQSNPQAYGRVISIFLSCGIEKVIRREVVLNPLVDHDPSCSSMGPHQ